MSKAVTLQDDAGNNIYPITDISLVGGSIGASKLASNAVTYEKLNLSEMNVYETFYKYVVSEDSDSNITCEIPIDFSKYQEIIVESYYEARNQSIDWNVMKVLNANKSSIQGRQCGFEMNQSSTLSGFYRENDQIIACGTITSEGSYVKATYVCGNLTNYPLFSGVGYGAGRFQYINGRTYSNPGSIKYVQYTLRTPTRSSWCIAYGIKRIS